MSMRTPSQTVGPFFSFGLCARPQSDVAESGIELRGRVLDGAGAPVPDAMVELWQADETGAYRGEFGWARCGTDASGEFRFTIVKPGPVGGQAPHLNVQVFARGLLKQVFTRIYFPGDEPDAVLASIGADRRHTLVAVEEDGGLRFDIQLQGDNETVFFDLGF
jgi:protocatechuate 3,4-dioxygenase, alpha subunit